MMAIKTTIFTMLLATLQLISIALAAHGRPSGLALVNRQLSEHSEAVTSTLVQTSVVIIGGSCPTACHTSEHSITPTQSASSSFAPTIASSSPASTIAVGHAPGCNHNKCLRELIRSSSIAAPFCAAYTQDVNTATTGLPEVVSQCHADPTRISSACSCLVTLPPDAQPTHAKSTLTSSIDLLSTSSVHTRMPTPPSYSTSKGISTSSLVEATSTVIVVTEEMTTLPVHPSTQTSDLLGPPTHSRSVSPTLQTSSSESTTSTSLASTSIASSSTLTIASSATLSHPLPSTTANSTSAFPISARMQACQYSVTGCKQAGMLFQTCINSKPNDTDLWNCLCKDNFTQWNSTSAICATCISSALPLHKPLAYAAPAEAPGDVALAIKLYCTAPQGKANFIKAGEILTSGFQAPLLWWDMSELKEPIAWRNWTAGVDGL